MYGLVHGWDEKTLAVVERKVEVQLLTTVNTLKLSCEEISDKYENSHRQFA